MKVSVFLLIIIAHSFLSPAEAQSKRKLYYSPSWEITKLDSAYYYRICMLDTINYHFIGEVSDYYLLSEKVVMTGRYDNSGKKNGEFTLYYDDGQVESTGEFKDDKRFGLWKYYFPNGKIWREVTFSVEDFFVNALYDETGKTQIKDGTGHWHYEYVDPSISKIITVEGSFTEGKKEGKWRCTSRNGDIIYEETFYKGKFKKGILLQDGRKMEYPSESQNKFLQPDKKFEMTEKFQFSDFVKRYDYPFFDFLPLSKTRLVVSEENEVFSVVEEPPTFKSGISGFYQLIGKNIQYPSEARRLGIKGKVFVEFIINTDGSISDIKVIKGIGGGCDEEAKRVVSLSPPWNPGKTNGKPVKVIHVIPISFNLGK